MRLRANRVLEREAVNAARAFFEANKCVFQEVDSSNDYGKDAYVDLPRGDEVSGLCTAVQIKGGLSYRHTGGDYRIPLTASHRKVWRDSTVPVIGIVYDPDDRLLRWVNLSALLRTERCASTRVVRVPADQILTPDVLNAGLRDSILATQGTVGSPFIDLRSSDSHVRTSAVADCFALGRRDAGYLIILRYLLKALAPDAREFAVHLLAHATPHPDIFWGKENWIEEHVKSQVREHFRWSVDEVLAMLAVASTDEFDRGMVGQDICLLLDQDPSTPSRLRDAAAEAARAGPEELAESALLVFVYWMGEAAPDALAELSKQVPQVRQLGMFPIIAEQLEDAGYISLF